MEYKNTTWDRKGDLIVTIVIMVIGFMCSQAHAAPVSEEKQVISIVKEMMKHHKTCDEVNDFLLDTALDHSIELNCGIDGSFGDFSINSKTFKTLK